jgi:Xaa-Pro aminopeptidase
MNYILKDENAVYYECGFSCDNELFLALGSEKFFITDARYTTEALQNIRCAEVIEAKDLNKAARELLRKSKISTLYYDKKEFSCADFEAIKRGLKINFKNRANLSWQKRVVKSEQEIEYIKKSVELNSEAFDEFASFLTCGISEKRAHFEAKRFLTRSGEYELSFEPIFAINENGAKPHAYPTNKILKKDDLILFDAGIKYKRYCSDRTRTANFYEGFSFSKEQKFKNAKMQRAYDVLLKAQEAAIKGVEAGMMAKDLDKIARDIIDSSEFKGCFIHSLGHGVGLDIHEMPFINSKNSQILQESMVFTIEPGIYIPNEFGIRIEDMVVIKNSKAEVL